MKFRLMTDLPNQSWSLSARRVWIEMSMPSGIVINPSASLSARRVWIEIEHLIVLLYPQYVTLREEGVD